MHPNEALYNGPAVIVHEHVMHGHTKRQLAGAVTVLLAGAVTGRCSYLCDHHEQVMVTQSVS